MENISRGTKCFGAWSPNLRNCAGAFPNGFMAWVKKQWWGEKRCYLCAGGIDDAEAIKVDIRPETQPTLCEDARHTSIPNESCDWIIIDPPYSLKLAKDLYGTEKNYAGINAFTKEAERICKKGGLICTLTYEIPKRIKNCDFIAVWGIYQIPSVSYMRCFTVSRKQGVE